jgi:hypothetical protein
LKRAAGRAIFELDVMRRGGLVVADIGDFDADFAAGRSERARRCDLLASDQEAAGQHET